MPEKEKGAASQQTPGISESKGKSNLSNYPIDKEKINSDKVKVQLALFKSRKDTKAKNVEWSWGELAEKCSNTYRGEETQVVYFSLPRTKQDSKKDVGGFVGGYSTNGRRKRGYILQRQIVTLDIDFADSFFWDYVFTLIYDAAAFIYSTRKHTPEKPRYRLVILLNRPVNLDEYEAVSRWIAGVLGIDLFDDTTFEYTRLMYWPSTSKDAEFVFHKQDGPPLDVDKTLNEYPDWTDSTKWPVSDSQVNIITREMKKQGDPIEKPGIVGAFCRTYTNIHDAIETFLSDVYEACDVEDRYTYKEGSTAAGLVIYDDKFAYSHHGTDPVGGKLCNVFDLVRIHRFGHLDENVKPNTPIAKFPSQTAMQILASNDEMVKRQIGIEKQESIKTDFSEFAEEHGEADPDIVWFNEVDLDRKGNPKKTVNNVEVIGNGDPRIKGKLAKNLFENREVALGHLPWRRVDPKDPYMINADDSGFRKFMEKEYGITGVQKTTDGLILIIKANEFHPVRDYLSQLKWDRDLRIETLFIDYLGAEDCRYVRTVTRKIIVAAVTRVFRPGCKYDYVGVLIGKEGIGKSTLLRKLGKSWFSDSFTTVSGKEAYEQIQGVWIVEMAELAGLKKAELETTKHFISKQEDRFRVAYGKRVENFPRQCIFIGTTNDREFLKSPTGDRRFWPVDTYETEPVKDVFKDLTSYEIDQIWAEAMELYKAGEPLYLDKELESEARKRQHEHREIDERVGLIEGYLNTPIPEDWYKKELYERRNYYLTDMEMRETGTWFREKICIPEIWYECFGRSLSELTPYNTRDYHNIMRNMEGWEEDKSSNQRFGEPGNQKEREKQTGYGRQKAYVRKSALTKIVSDVNESQREKTIINDAVNN